MAEPTLDPEAKPTTDEDPPTPLPETDPAEPKVETPPPPAAPKPPTPPHGEDPRWLTKRLAKKETQARLALARELGYDSVEEMQASARKGAAPAKPQDAPQLQSLRTRVSFLEKENERLKEEIQATQSDHVIELAAVRVGITSPQAMKLFTVLFAEEVEKHPEIFDNITAEKLSEQALGFAKSLKDAHGGLFDVRSPGLSTAPPAGPPKPAEPQVTPADDTKLDRRSFEAKVRGYETGIPA